MNELKIKDEENSDEDRSGDGKAGKLARREQGASVGVVVRVYTRSESRDQRSAIRDWEAASI
jgi:hypothetical protein